MTTPDPTFETMTEAVNWLQTHGYERDFNLEQDCILYGDAAHKLYAGDFHVDYVFRFEGDTDPGDENIVYGIRSADSTLRGLLISGYGVYSDGLAPELAKKLTFSM